jgi:cation diffusion facilitator CzcD-associated flavoprotein CzcO
MAIESFPAPPKAALPALSLVDGTKPENVDAVSVAQEWIRSLRERLKAKDFSGLDSLFVERSWWRDFLALTWDMRSIEGMGPITKYLTSSDHNLEDITMITTGGLQPVLMNMGGQWITAGFNFTTKFGTGRGCVYLINTGPSEWKAWIVHTQLEKLHEKSQSQNQANGTTNGKSYDHKVIIVGGGQAGMALAAYLQASNITDYLILDKHEMAGGAWNSRYDSVTAHTPKFSDNWAFANYPEDFPMWPKRNDLVKWMKSYAAKLRLNIQYSTNITEVTRATGPRGLFTIHLTDNASGNTSTMTCQHVVLAAGIFADIPRVPTFPSQSRFKGPMYHTSKHSNAAAMAPDVKSKRIAIIGTGTSAHDIAADYVNAGAKSVTLVQRGAIFSLSRKSVTDGFMAAYNPANGATNDEADIVTNAIPTNVLRSLGVGMTMQMSEWDREMLDGLEEKGVRLKRGHDGDGFPDWLLVRHGCFYIDQGANQMIMDGKIKFVSSEGGVKDVDERGVVLDDGKVVEADVLVLATGFERNIEVVRKLMGNEAVKKVGNLGYMDEEGERVGVSLLFVSFYAFFCC